MDFHSIRYEEKPSFTNWLFTPLLLGNRSGLAFLASLDCPIFYRGRLRLSCSLSREVKCDLVWRDYILENWNGKSFLVQNWQVPADSELTLDAATNCGCAAVFGNSWFALRWPRDITLPHISLLELILIILAASVWGRFWSGQRVLFQCDNRAAVEAVLQKYTQKNPHLLKLLRLLARFAIQFRFNFSAVHVEGKLNPWADAFSRFRSQVFRELFRQKTTWQQISTLPCSKTYFVHPRCTLAIPDIFWPGQVASSVLFLRATSLY